MSERISGLARVAVVALALALGVGQFMLPATVLAEDNNPNPPPPKPKDPPPPPDPCAGSRTKTACKAAEAVRSLLREAPPLDPHAPAGATAGGSGSVATQP